jgi:hypothetical protein|tara:strand:- start:86 stop:262 length:177 start_codon:yes stop_codon:yes gene_type:complete
MEIDKVKKNKYMEEFVGYIITYKDSNLKVCCPINEDNKDYKEVIEWEKIDGNNIEEAD